MVAPAAVRLLGHNVNKWSFAGADARTSSPASWAGGEEAGAGRRERDRAPAPDRVAGAMEMIPPDPRQLPEGSEGLEDEKVRAAGFGPTVEVAIRAPEGAVLDPRDLKQIQRLERRLGRIPNVTAAFGPAMGEQTKSCSRGAKSIRQARRNLRQGQRELDQAAQRLAEGVGGVRQARRGLLIGGVRRPAPEAGSARERARTSSPPTGVPPRARASWRRARTRRAWERGRSPTATSYSATV